MLEDYDVRGKQEMELEEALLWIMNLYCRLKQQFEVKMP